MQLKRAPKELQRHGVDDQLDAVTGNAAMSEVDRMGRKSRQLAVAGEYKERIGMYATLAALAIEGTVVFIQPTEIRAGLVATGVVMLALGYSMVHSGIRQCLEADALMGDVFERQSLEQDGPGIFGSSSIGPI